MSERKKLFAEFPPVTTEQWMEKITADLKGADFDKKLVWRTNEGFSVKPFYRQEDLENLSTLNNSEPGAFPYLRGVKTDNSWRVRQNIYVKDPVEANKKALDLLEKGVEAIGYDIPAKLVTEDNILTLIQNIHLDKIEVNFNTQYTKYKLIVNTIVDLVLDQNLDITKVQGSINYDPFQHLMLNKEFHVDSFHIACELVDMCKLLPEFKVLNINAQVLGNNGAYIAQELGFALAWGNQFMKLANADDVVLSVSKKIKFNLSVGSNYFLEIAKFRAARLLWAKIMKAYNPVSMYECHSLCEEDTECHCATKMHIHAITTEWNLTIYDAYVNMLRTQTEAMSAALGGVDSMTVLPFDTPFKDGDEFSERIARNQQLLLKEESYFDKIVDPAAGSYYIETLTASIAEQAWKIFLEVEDKGGFYKCIQSGYVQDEIEKSAKARLAAIAARKEILLGTNQFPNFNENVAEKTQSKTKLEFPKDKASEQPVKTLSINRGSQEFDALRLDTEKLGKRPKVFMLTIGNLAMRLARAQFSSNFFACAGYEIIDNLGFDTVEAGVKAAREAFADIIVLCSSDDEYATYAPQAHVLIEDKEIFVVAGAMACMDELKKQGIIHFINVRSNVLETLTEYNAMLSKKRHYIFSFFNKR